MPGPIKGKVFVVPNAKERTYEVLVVNESNMEIGVTHNVVRQGEENLAVHDDHGRYGHGLPVRPNDGGAMSFKYGDMYRNVCPIQEGSVLRIGLRYAAVTTVVLPPLDGDMIEIDFNDFQWYGQANANMSANMRGYMQQAQNKGQLDMGKDAVRARVEQLIAAKRKGPPCAGQVTVTAVPGKGGSLSHWEVRFDNKGDTPWIGTCVFEGAQKNSGLGLESMACPDKGSGAMQRIEANGNYGVIAQAGSELRLGVRGWGSFNVPLPSAGSVNVDLKQFKLQSSEVTADFFDKGKVEEKRQEKMAKVQFFAPDGRALNAELKPIVYRGQEALQKTDFAPPHVVVSRVADGPDTPGGGWMIELENKLPANDGKVDGNPEIGFVATLRVGDEGGELGWDPRQLPPKKFEAPSEKKTWFLPDGANVNGVEAKAGEKLVVGTRGLGWYSVIDLPAKGHVDTDKNADLWAFREDQFARQNLLRAFTSRCRN